jgi:uncharacterized protein
MTLLIAGLSTRAIAESAVRSGGQVITLDYFGDRDQRVLVENVSLMRDFQIGFSAEALLTASQTLVYDELVYIANLENYPGIVEAMTGRRVLCGNPPAVLREVRDWRALRRWAAENDIPVPTTLLPGEEFHADPTRRWLVKPARSGGGHGIHFWAGERLSEGTILQEHLTGRPASVAFVADGRRCVLLGITEQLIGETHLGAQAFRWCGNILPLATPAEKHSVLIRSVTAMAAGLTQRFHLCGLNGIDLIVSDQGQPFLLEINPRYTASMELIEQAHGGNLFSLHREGCLGNLPELPAIEWTGPFWGKGIVTTRRAVTIPVTDAWYERGRRDIPYTGERIAAGHPVCTVLVQGPDRDACWRELTAAADAVSREIGDETGDYH